MSDNNYDKELMLTEQEEEITEAIENRKALEADLEKSIWGYSNTGIEAKRAAMSMLSTKTGMYARIPLMCKGDGCPYAETCKLVQFNLAPLGEPCPVEVAQIEARLAGYEKDFDFDACSFTDKVLISDLINHDIMLERCKALLTKEGTLVQDVFAGVSEDGEVYYRPEVSKNWEAFERIQKKRNEIYDLMMATRKNKKGTEGNNEDDISSEISKFINEGFVIDKKPGNIIDVEENE